VLGENNSGFWFLIFAIGHGLTTALGLVIMVVTGYFLRTQIPTEDDYPVSVSSIGWPSTAGRLFVASYPQASTTSTVKRTATK